MLKKIEKITVIGSGSAGCLAANHFANNMDIPVDFIMSGKPPIGVGEATLIGFDDFLYECGLTNPTEWMYNTDATIKNGILSQNFRPDGKPAWHPFMSHPQYQIADQKKYDSYDEYLFNSFNYKTCVVNNQTAFNCKLAFHVDALKLVKMLVENFKKFSNGNIIVGEVAELITSESDNMHITKIKLKNEAGEITTLENPGLIIDATGFNGLKSIMPEQFKADYDDVSDILDHNAAIAYPVPYMNKSSHPYTKCSFVGNGWIWEIPLKTRIGSGLVYNRDKTTIDEALETFNKFHNLQLTKEEVNSIQYSPQLCKNPWRGNLVNIGLSCGFIEPLESTGIGLFIDAIAFLWTQVRRPYHNQNIRDLFNTYVYLRYRECSEFVSAHYNHIPHKRAKSKLEYVELNQEIYHDMRYKKTKKTNIGAWHGMFQHYSWEFLYEGMLMLEYFKEKR